MRANHLLVIGMLFAIHAAPAWCELVEPPARVVPNDNRRSTGTLRDGVVELALEARPATWYPSGQAGRPVPAFAFAEAGGPPRIPGPFLRVPQGTELSISVRNSIPEGRWIGLPPENRRNESTSSVTGAALYVHGLTAGTGGDDLLVVPYGETRDVRFRAGNPGTFI
jgi:FtsP/CotA-like multicopper oxidase with cupredoxin domain